MGMNSIARVISECTLMMIQMKTVYRLRFCKYYENGQPVRMVSEIFLTCIKKFRKLHMCE